VPVHCNSDYGALRRKRSVPEVDCLHSSAVGTAHLAHAANGFIRRRLQSVTMRPVAKLRLTYNNNNNNSVMILYGLVDGRTVCA